MSGDCKGEDMSDSPVKVHPLKGVKEGQYSNPVYKTLSAINGEINRMSRDELQSKLKELQLDARGIDDVLRKRLKSFFRQRKLTNAHVSPKKNSPDYLLVIDFEATCEQNNDQYRHEIIEFPVILVSLEKKQVIDEFHSYCKPRVNPQLSEFCVQLTGITQDKVDQADEFPEVLKRMESWMKSQSLGTEKKFAIATDGPWDMSRFMFMQCRHNKMPFPRWASRWINIRKAYSNFYQCKRTKLNEMLVSLGMTFEGHQHSGLDDSRNIARIVIRLAEDGCELKVNEYLHYDRKDHTLNAKSLTQDSASTTPPSDEELDKSLSQLTMNDGASDADDVDDLLEYYRLQKA